MSALGSVVIVGASLAGHATARALRQQGFDGRISIIGDEPERPYDRPPLSKEFLAGTASEADIALEAEDEALGADWLLGVRAETLDLGTRTVSLSDGGQITGDAVVIATGSTARLMPTHLRGVHTLRTLPDARRLKEDLRPGARLVVIGAGFIGAEVAATAHELGLQVTVLEAAAAPLLRQLGEELGRVVAGLHAANGVPLHCGVPVSGLVGRDRVEGVELADGAVIPADVVLAGIGAAPATAWLRSSGLDLSNGVICDSHGSTDASGVYAVGDCSAWFDPALGHAQRVEHWTDSRDRPAIAVRALLDSDPVGQDNQANAGGHTQLPAPYFWSDQYGVRIQFAGYRLETDEYVIEEGSAKNADLLATWRRNGEIVAVLGLNQMRAFTRHRKSLGRIPAGR